MQISCGKDWFVQNNTLPLKYYELLRQQGFRNTKERRLIFELLLKSKIPMTRAMIVEKMSDINKSSVYRILKSFTEANITKVVPRGFKTFYEVSEAFHEHHHHLVCDVCGHLVEIHNHQLEEIIYQLTCQNGMIPTTHNIEVHGICSKCIC